LKRFSPVLPHLYDEQQRAAAGAPPALLAGWQHAACGTGGLRRKLRVLLAWRDTVPEIKSAWHHLSNRGMFESDY
jgi:hypothetical protein